MTPKLRIAAITDEFTSDLERSEEHTSDLQSQ